MVSHSSNLGKVGLKIAGKREILFSWICPFFKCSFWKFLWFKWGMKYFILPLNPMTFIAIFWGQLSSKYKQLPKSYDYESNTDKHLSETVPDPYLCLHSNLLYNNLLRHIGAQLRWLLVRAKYCKVFLRCQSQLLSSLLSSGHAQNSSCSAFCTPVQWTQTGNRSSGKKKKKKK